MILTIFQFLAESGIPFSCAQRNANPVEIHVTGSYISNDEMKEMVNLGLKVENGRLVFRVKEAA